LEKGSKSTVAEVSYAVGFETPTYFSKLYKEEYGRKPVEYFR
jgi:AraC-like DNA-binding protein